MRHLPHITRLVTSLLAAVLLVPGALAAAQKLTPAEARYHVGEEATVCGKVVSTRYAAGSSGQPTFLNLDKPYPNQVFTVVIWREDRGKFAEPPEDRYRDKRICVTGEISSYRGEPQIVVDEPRQIEVLSEPRAAPPPPPAPVARNCIPRSECCRICTKGRACGNSCISASYTCRKGRGCACNSWEVCR